MERIAVALESLASLRPQHSSSKDESAALYFDDVEDMVKEAKREAYMQATGIRLLPGEDPPKHG